MFFSRAPPFLESVGISSFTFSVSFPFHVSCGVRFFFAVRIRNCIDWAIPAAFGPRETSRKHEGTPPAVSAQGPSFRSTKTNFPPGRNAACAERKSDTTAVSASSPRTLR